jgi:hypothetical protein
VKGRAAVVAALLGAGAAGLGSGSSAQGVHTIRVTLHGGRATIVPARIPPGVARVLVRNAGPGAAVFAIAGKTTPLLAPGERIALRVRFAKAGRYVYRVLGARRSRGVLTVARGGSFRLLPVGTFDSPVLVTAPPADVHRVFVVEQTGVVRELLDGKLMPAPFLDLSGSVLDEGENGLLGMAFAPDYSSSRRFYVYYNDRSGNVHLVGYRTKAGAPDSVDLSSARQILSIVKPYSNHNAGMLQFGPDGDLYVAVGDGDSGVKHPPGTFAQTLNDLLGDILRIDPAHGDPYTVPRGNPFARVAGDRPEVWDYGLRNPWRFWIDWPTGDLYIGDVQLGGPEEVDYVKGNTGGQNFGWPCFQGTVRFDASASCQDAVPPLVQYSHDVSRCGVIGGVTIHDPALPTLAGYYLYGDLCGGEIKALTAVDGRAVNAHPLHLTVPGLDSFGVDAAGHVYAMSIHGAVYRLATH